MLNKKLLFIVLFFSIYGVFAQKSQGIGTNTPNPRAVLDINVENSSTYPQGFLMPRLTTAQRSSLGTVAGLAIGMAVYDTDDKNFYTWNGTLWKSTGSIVNTIIGTGGIVVSNVGGNFTISGGSQWINSGSSIYYSTSVGIGGINTGLSILEVFGQVSATSGFLGTGLVNGGNQAGFDFVGTNEVSLRTGGLSRLRINNIGIASFMGSNFVMDGGLQIKTLSTTGSVLTVDGAGNIGMGTIQFGNNYWLPNGATMIYTNSTIGINTTNNPYNDALVVTGNGKFTGVVEVGDNAPLNAQKHMIMTYDYTLNLGRIFAYNQGVGPQAILLQPDANPNASIGIGITTTPTARLDINGTIRFRSFNTSGSILTVDGLGNVGMAASTAFGSKWSLSTGFSRDLLLPNAVNSQTPTIYLKSLLSNTTATSGLIIGNSDGYEGSIYFTAASFSSSGFDSGGNSLNIKGGAFSGQGTNIFGNRVRIFGGGPLNQDPDLIVTPSNKVGIGGGFLDPNGTTAASLFIKTNSASILNFKALDLVSNGNNANNSVDLRFGLVGGGNITGSQAETSYQAKISGILNGNGNNAGHLAFYTNDGVASEITERMRIHSKGAVGIGVNTFTGNEALRIGGLNPTSPRGLVFPYVTTAQMVVLTAQLGVLDAGMIFFNTDKKNVEIWDGTQWQGRDGGGGGNNDFNQTWNIFGNNSIGGTNMSVAGFGRMGTADNYGLAIQTNNQTRIFVNTTGGVGIGFASNVMKSTLQVNGDLGLGNGTETGNKPVVVWLKNAATNANPDDIVVVATGAGQDDSFNITNIASNNAAIGVLMETCPNGAVCKVAVAGIVSVNVSSLSTITRGQHCVTSTNPGLAVSTATPNPGASIGVFLQDAGGAITKARVLLR